MASVFEFDNYRKFLEKRLVELPNKGYGQMSRLARFLGVHSTLVSQILKEHKDLTTDQAASTAEYFELTELETEYFVLLVQIDRAGNSAAKSLYRKQILRLKEQAQSISRRVKVETKLSEEQRAVFYSDWAYTSVRQSVAIPKICDAASIAQFLDLPRKKVQSILEFLVKTGLLKMTQNQFEIGPASTHLEASSPWVRVHHSNWRHRAVQSLDSGRYENLHYTSPLTISTKDVDLIREKIIQFIEQVNLIVDPSPSESLYCLNIDWFNVLK